MSIYVTYYLNFRASFHLGRRGVGLETTEISIPADTLFSALCQMWRTFYEEQSLTDFLTQYETDTPFLLTSAFPFAGNTRFFPKPLIDLNVNAGADLKKLKRVRYLSERRFGQIINGGPIAFDTDNLINDGQLWIHDDDKCPSAVWNTERRPRVTLDRQSFASEIWHLGAVKFHENCGLWFDAKFDTHKTKEQVETILRVLGDTGIGGERSAGFGLFDLRCQATVVESAQGTCRFVTLSPICPRDAAELDQLLDGDVGYTLEERSGWIGSAEGSGQQRQKVMVFAEGSVLSGSGKQVGRLIDLKPSACPHPVWRYGYGWPIKI